MNEFTKDELILLACWSVNRFDQVGSDQAKDEGTISLSTKIQSLLINYGYPKYCPEGGDDE